MSVLTQEKLDQAEAILRGSNVDAWLLFVRESSDGGDAALPLLVEGAFVWQSAFLFTPAGHRVAIVGSYDAEPLSKCPEWTEVIPYVEGIGDPLARTLDRIVPGDVHHPRLAVNYSLNDDKADGLSHGMFLLLEGYLKGTRFERSMVSAEQIVGALRSRKTEEELRRIQAAIADTELIFREIERIARPGLSERALYHEAQKLVRERGLGFAWDSAANPIVNSGPDSSIGHAAPSDRITIAPGHILHVDLGVVKELYSSDMQRCWYVA
ncbi:MAG TPA: M24 family metallopeptidase, partial [Chthonomonadales bacterium]|nr:M24 family metallopeptidase [Chthonomonadales bacterium]